MICKKSIHIQSKNKTVLVQCRHDRFLSSYFLFHSVSLYLCVIYITTHTNMTMTETDFFFVSRKKNNCFCFCRYWSILCCCRFKDHYIILSWYWNIWIFFVVCKIDAKEKLHETDTPKQKTKCRFVDVVILSLCCYLINRPILLHNSHNNNNDK